VIKAIGYNITSDEKEIIKKMGSVLDASDIEIIDIKSFEVKNEVDISDILFIYGQRAERETDKIKCSAKLHFPELNKLKNNKENTSYRQAALDTLTNFKNISEQKEKQVCLEKPVEQTKSKILEKSLPDISASQIKTLEQNIKEKGQTAWVGTTKDNKTIRLTTQPEKSPADINMTFAELYFVKSLIETFQVKEVEVVYKSNIDSRENSA